MRSRLRASWFQQLGISAGFALLVFSACLVGIYSRLPGTLAVFWPANALLLGLLVRFPSTATVTTWLAAAAGYLGADLATGSTMVKAVLLNSANLVGVLAGFVMVRRIFTADLRLTSMKSVGWLAIVASLSAATAGVVGGIAQTVLFRDPFGSAWLGWYAEEVLNYTVILPVILTFPTHGTAPWRRVNGRRLVVPTVFLLTSAIPAWFMPGIGTVGFSVPAMIIVALMSSVFVTTLFLVVTAGWSLNLIVHHGAELADGTAIPIQPSAMIGLAMLSFAPLTIAAVTAERRRAYRVLRTAMEQDDLTGAFRRGEFLRRAEAALPVDGGRPAALLMMDLDHFKRLNDTRGHLTGDQALVDFATAVREMIGDEALFARMGGEEFALLLPDTGRAGAVEIAERIRSRQQKYAATEFDGETATVSIGLAWTAGRTVALGELLVVSDRALYRAKTNQRNTVVVAEITPRN